LCGGGVQAASVLVIIVASAAILVSTSEHPTAGRDFSNRHNALGGGGPKPRLGSLFTRV